MTSVLLIQSVHGVCIKLFYMVSEVVAVHVEDAACMHLTNCKALKRIVIDLHNHHVFCSFAQMASDCIPQGHQNRDGQYGHGHTTFSFKNAFLRVLFQQQVSNSHV